MIQSAGNVGFTELKRMNDFQTDGKFVVQKN